MLVTASSVTLASASDTEIRSRGIGSDGYGGSVAYTVGYNAMLKGEVGVGINHKTSFGYITSTASGKGTFTATVGYGAAPKNCKTKHYIVK